MWSLRLLGCIAGYATSSPSRLYGHTSRQPSMKECGVCGARSKIRYELASKSCSRRPTTALKDSQAWTSLGPWSYNVASKVSHQQRLQLVGFGCIACFGNASCSPIFLKTASSGSRPFWTVSTRCWRLHSCRTLKRSSSCRSQVWIFHTIPSGKNPRRRSTLQHWMILRAPCRPWTCEAKASSASTTGKGQWCMSVVIAKERTSLKLPSTSSPTTAKVGATPSTEKFAWQPATG
mmetsp:Transcript_2573/g.6481  ORF Transcript_2573/g.6481 Transcript_2573/m.6481 type:complete len:234 (+) Transcript_2573:1838-2539(+)